MASTTTNSVHSSHNTSTLSSIRSQDARRFLQIAIVPAEPDADVWVEKIAVIESAYTDGRPKLLLRSYYRNQRTQERVWDEPPSGACHVSHATPDMRTRAEEKRDDLRRTLDMIPPEAKTENQNDEDGSNDSYENSNDADASVETTKTKAPKKKRGLFGSMFKRKEKHYVDDSKDLNLQKAIAESMNVTFEGSAASSSTNFRAPSPPKQDKMLFDKEELQGEQDEDVALAMALSLSAEGNTPRDVTVIS